VTVHEIISTLGIYATALDDLKPPVPPDSQHHDRLPTLPSDRPGPSITHAEAGASCLDPRPLPHEGTRPMLVAAMRDFRDTATLLLFLAVLCGLTAAWADNEYSAGFDFYQFWVVGQALGQPEVGNVYADAERRRIGATYLERARAGDTPRQLAVAEVRPVLETYSTPFLYATFRFFSTGDYETDYRNYRLIQIVLLVAGLAIFCRALGYPLPALLAAVLVFAVWFKPVVSDMRVGNVNSIQLAVLAAWLGWRRRSSSPAADGVGGLILGLAVMFKPNLIFVPGLLVVFWLVHRRTETLAWHAVGGAVAVGLAAMLSTLSFGRWAWGEWLAALQQLPNDIITVELGNFGLAPLIRDWLAFELALVLTLLFGALAVVGIVAGRRRASSRPEGGAPESGQLHGEAVVVAMGCLVMLLGSELVWLHYFVLAIPMLLVLFRPLAAARPSRSDVIARRILPAVVFPLVAIDPITNLGSELTDHQMATAISLGALVLFGLGMREFVASRGDTSPQPPDLLKTSKSHRN
jgi:hypothetical protein